MGLQREGEGKKKQGEHVSVVLAHHLGAARPVAPLPWLPFSLTGLSELPLVLCSQLLLPSQLLTGASLMNASASSTHHL